MESFPDIASQDSQIVAFLDKLQLGDVDDGGWREKMRCEELPSLYPVGPVSITYFTVCVVPSSASSPEHERDSMLREMTLY